jgi:hypothetical protein
VKLARLLVDLDYRGSARLIQPDALPRAKAGDLLGHAIKYA